MSEEETFGNYSGHETKENNNTLAISLGPNFPTNLAYDSTTAPPPPNGGRVCRIEI